MPGGRSFHFHKKERMPDPVADPNEGIFRPEKKRFQWDFSNVY